MVDGVGEHTATSAAEAIEKAYAREETDEFIAATRSWATMGVQWEHSGRRFGVQLQPPQRPAARNLRVLLNWSSRV
jgi:hypothetical protein